MKKISNGIRIKRSVPDKRITVTKDIVMIEYANGFDMVLTREHPKAKQIINTICLR